MCPSGVVSFWQCVLLALRRVTLSWVTLFTMSIRGIISLGPRVLLLCWFKPFHLHTVMSKITKPLALEMHYITDYPAHCLQPYFLLKGNFAGGNLALLTYRHIASKDKKKMKNVTLKDRVQSNIKIKEAEVCWTINILGTQKWYCMSRSQITPPKSFFFLLLNYLFAIYWQILANKQWGEKPILDTSSSWTPRWLLSGPYSCTSVKSSALTVKALERLNGFEGIELSTVWWTATDTLGSIGFDMIYFFSPLT